MKKIYLVLFSLIIDINISHAQVNWLTYKIDDKLSIKMPAQPVKIPGGMEAHTADSLVCFANIIDAADSVVLAKMVTTESFANGLKNAMIASGKDISLGDIKLSKWNGYYCYKVDGTDNENKLKLSFYFVIAGKNIYCLGAAMPYSHNLADKELYFSTLKLN